MDGMGTDLCFVFGFLLPRKDGFVDGEETSPMMVLCCLHANPLFVLEDGDGTVCQMTSSPFPIFLPGVMDQRNITVSGDL